MSCVVSYQDLQGTLLEAYKTDFEKYKNFSAIVQDVISLSNLPEESKIHAIWFYAGYINSAASSIDALQTIEWKEGKYAAIHNYITPFLNGKSEFNYLNILSEVQKMLKVELDTDTQTIESKIAEDILDLKKVPTDQLLKSVDSIAQTILDNRENLDPVIIDANNTLALELLDNLIDTLRKMDNPNRYIIDRVYAIKREIREMYDLGQSYIDLSRVRGIGTYNGEPIKKMRKHLDGSYHEVVWNRVDNTWLYYNPGQSNHLQPVEIEEFKDSITEILTAKNNPSDISRKNGNLRLSLEDISSGIFLGKSYTYGTTDQELETTVENVMSRQLAVGANFMDGIDIKATLKNSQLLAKRKARIDEAFPDGRISVETYEYPAAKDMLRSGQGPILTYSLPTDGFDLLISTKDGDFSFSPIASASNLIFLYPDNTVEKVDFKNPQHRQLLKNKLEIRNLEWDYSRMSDYHSATDEEVDKLEKAHERYLEFTKEVKARINEKGTDEVSIKDIFNKYYDLTNNILSLKFGTGLVVKSSLQEHIDKFDGRLSATIIDENGEKLPFQKIPIIIVRNKNGFMEFVNPLKSNQKIVSEDGKVYTSFKIFMEENYPQINIQEIGKKIPKRGAAYINLIPTTYGYRSTINPLNFTTAVNSDYDKMNLAATMMMSFDKSFIEKGNKFMPEFNNKFWGFNVIDSNIFPQFVIRKQTQTKQKVFGIKFTILNKTIKDESGERLLYTQDQINEFNNFAKDHLDFGITQGVLYGPNGLFTVVDEIFKDAGITVPKNISVQEFGELAVKALSQVKNPNLVKRLNEAYMNLSSDIRGRFDFMLSKAPENPLVDENLKKNSLFVGDEREFNIKNRTKTAFDTNPINNFVVVDAENLETQIRVFPKDYSQRISFLPSSILSSLNASDVDAGTIVSANTVVTDVPKEGVDGPGEDPGTDEPGTNSSDFPTDIDPLGFSVVQSLQGIMMLSESEFAKEIQTMKELLPDSFTFNLKDLSGLDIDGQALGYIKKLSIFLNSTIKARGVAYHEGFHGVFRNLLTTKQQQYYLSKVAKSLGDYKEDENGKYILVNGNKVYANEFRKERRFIHLTDEQIKNLIYEEYLADSFAEYMEKNKAPRTWMEKLFAWLKSIINRFRKEGDIQNLFYDISTGKFKSATIRDTISNTETAYSTYKGIPYLRLRDVTKPFSPTNRVVKYNLTVQSHVVNDVSSKILKRMIELKNIHLGNYVEKDMSDVFPNGTSEIFSAKTKVTEEDLYDIAAQDVAKEFQIDNLIRQKPKLEKEIREKYEDSWNTSLWLLGEFHKNNVVFKLKNDSGLSSNDNVILDSNDKDQINVSIANAELFKQDVLTEFKNLSVVEAEKEQSDDEIAKYEKEDYTDTGSFITAKPDEGDAAFQQLFKYISYDYTDPILGVTYKKMVDSKNIFNTIRKITSRTVDKIKILPAIQDQINISTGIINNFYLNIQPNLLNKNIIPEDISKEIQLRDSLRAVMNTLDGIVHLDEGFLPKTNVHVFNQFTKVFNLVDMSSIQVNLETTFKRDNELKRYVPSDQVYRVSDIVIGSDINKVRQSLYERLRLVNVPETVLSSAIESLDAINELNDSNIVFSKYTTNGVYNEAAGKKLAQKVYAALTDLNLGIPYSAVELGIIYAISNVYEKARETTQKSKVSYFPEGTYARTLLKQNKSILPSLKFFTPDLLGELLPKILRLANGKGTITTNPELLTSSRIFLYKYTSAFGEYIINHDPTLAGSTTKNANGNIVQKFVRPVPAVIALLKLQSKEDIAEGLEELIKEDFEGFESYFKDNPMFDTSNPKNAKFLSNLKLSAFAGFEQTQKMMNNPNFEKGNEATTFSDIDDKAYTLSMMGLFINRIEDSTGSKDKNGIDIKVKTFKRILSQFEGTSTSLVVDGMYDDYFQESYDVVDDKTVKIVTPKKGSKGTSLISEMLLLAAKQEYNAIRKNFTDHRLNNPVQKFEGYNVKLTDRGFRFVDCADFFALNVDPLKAENNEDLKQRRELADSLTKAASEDKDFDDFLKENPEVYQNITNQLDKFSDEQYKVFEILLKDLNISDADLPTTEQKSAASTNETITSTERLKKEFFFNTWFNGIFVNQLFEGQKSVGLKNAADYFKRQKSGAAAGPNLSVANSKNKNYRLAVMQKIKFWINNKQLNDQQPLDSPPLDADGKPLDGWVEVDFIDGQSYNNISRIKRVLEPQGKLTDDVRKILNTMRYHVGLSDKRYKSAIKRLRDAGITFNSLKTVSASPMFYVKQSEHLLLRKDVSVLRPEYRTATDISGKDVVTRKAYQELDELWEMADFYSMMIEEGSPEKMQEYADKYNFVMKKIHSYYKPIKGKEILHNMLNSMELHRIDQLTDQNSTKRATPETLKFNIKELNSDDFYLDLDKAIAKVPNIYTVIQLETGHQLKNITQGIQQKLLIMAQLDPESPEYKQIKQDIRNYNEDLANVVDSQLENIRRIVNGNDGGLLAELYTNIADGLRAQGNTSDLKWFELDENGNIKYDPGLPAVGKAIEYYLYSFFNNNLFDKKVNGEKYYHISPFGYKIREKDGKIITQDEYLKNPEAYDDAIVRYPEIKKEIVETVNQETGKKEKVTRYVVEVIVPKALRDIDKSLLEKYMAEKWRDTFFATRIPTEGKRSMMVCKIVDYMDEAYGNGIVVPFQLHMLAGSDFDIDSLYAYKYDTYTSITGEKIIYGDYTYYTKNYKMTKDEAKFIEYLTHIGKDPLYKAAINNEIKRINQQATTMVVKKKNVGSAARMKMNILRNIRDSFGRTNMTKLLDNISKDPEDYDTVIRFIATFNVLKKLEDSNLPTTVAQLKASKINHVPYVTFNKILESKIKMLQDPKVFENFMTNETERAAAAAAPYAELVSDIKMSEQEIYARQHVSTPTALIKARSLNSEFGDCLGIAASMNKIVSLLETISAKLNNPIVTLYDNDTKISIEGVTEGAVQRVGGAVGVYADAIKSPYPGPLSLNFYNTPVYLTMTALGVPLKAAIMFQSIPVLKRVISDFKETSKSAYSSSLRSNPKSFPKFLSGKINDLKQGGTIDNSIFEEGELKNFKIRWTGKVSETTDDQILSGDIPLSNFGYEITSLSGKKLNKDTENFIALSLFKDFLNVSNDISFNLNKVTDPLKALNPDQDQTDKLVNTIKNLKENPDTASMFTGATIQKLFKNNPVLGASLSALQYVSKSSKNVLIEKTSFVKGLTKLFGSFMAYEDDFDTKSEIRSDIKAIMSLYFQRLSAESNPDSFINSLYLEQLDANNFLTEETVNSFRELKQKFPDNQFLLNITPVTEGDPTIKVATLLETRSGISSKTREDMENDLLFLLTNSDPDIRRKAYRVAFHGMIKSGGQKISGSYYDVLPAPLSKGMSDRMKDFRKDLLELDEIVEKEYKLVLNADNSYSIPATVRAKYRNKLKEIISKHFPSANAEDFITSVIVKVVSSRVKRDDYVKNVINIQRLGMLPLDLYEALRLITPNINNIITVTKNGESITYSKPYIQNSTLSDNEYELFTPVGNSVLLDLSKIDINEESMDNTKKILSNEGIYRSAAGNFYFPLYKINAYNQLLVLKELDDKPLSDSFIDTLAETDLNTSDGPRQLQGKKALYVVASREGTDKISPLGFSNENGVQIRNTLYPVQQVSSEALEKLPSAFNINDTLGRMYGFNTSEMPKKEYRSKSFISTNGKVVSVGNRFMKYYYSEGKLYSKVNGVSQPIEIVESRLDAFANIFKKSDWNTLKNDPNFEDFLNGQKNIFVYDLITATEPIKKEFTPAPEIRKTTPTFNSLPGKSSTPTMTYAGIGSRQTPPEILDKMTEAAKYLEGLGYTLRSGGAEGADTAFEKGVKSKKEIFKGLDPTGPREKAVAHEIHPDLTGAMNASKRKAEAAGKNGDRSAAAVENLMARNTNQIFGKNLDTPVDFVLAYDPSGWTGVGPRPQKGGTLQAIDMAARKGIPVINMADANWREQLKSAISGKSQIKTISEPYGVVVAETNPTKEFDQKLANAIYDDVAENAYVENGSNTSQRMWGNGLMWKGNNTKKPTGKPLKVVPAQVDYNANGKLTPVKSKYFYDPLYNDGTPVAPISNLDFLKRHIESTLGIDMSDYDVSLNNIYEEGHNLFRHTDIDESNTAKNYPVIVYVFGNTHKVRFDDNGGKRAMGTMVNPKTLTLKNGDIYTFGMDGKGRFETVHDVVASPKTDANYPTLIGSDGKPTNKYTVTFTFRRAADLEPGMPTSPAKLTASKPTPSPSQEIAPTAQPTTKSVKPTVKDLSRWSDIKDATTPYTDKGIVVTRISGSKEHFGNPFIGSKRRDKNGNIVESKVDNITMFNTIDEADQAYRDWLMGTKHQNIEPLRREWILKQINEGKLDGKTLLYYKPMEVTNNDGTIVKGGYHSHADTLAEIVEQLRTTQPTGTTTIKPGVSELFESNPALANDVYDALGIQKYRELKSFDDYYKLIPYQENKLNQYDIDRLSIIAELLDETNDQDLYTLVKNKKAESDNYNSKSSFLSEREFFSYLADLRVNSIRQNIEEYKQGDRFAGKKVLTKILKTSLDEIVDTILEARQGIVEVTSEQKKYAEEVYFQYLQTTDNPTIKGFKEFVAKSAGTSTETAQQTEDAGYKYYGATYTIILENGKAVGIKNYKGKPAAKQKILDAYNVNPDVDIQNGKQFRNFPSKKEEGSKKEEQNENKKYELFPGVYANEGQRNAIDKIENFLDGKSDQFLLKGRGGTGKTTIIKKAIQKIPQSKVIGATISDEAKGILQENMPGYKVVTIASLLGLIPDYNPRTGEIFFREKEEYERKFNKFTGEPIPEPIEVMDYIIIDEASMIDSTTYNMLLSKKKPNAKIIFMGDNVQIPPINNEGKDSPVWELAKTENFAELNERMRQGKESPILGITDLYAENVENIQANRPSVANPLTERVTQFENGEGVIFLNDREDFINQYINEITTTKSSKQAIIVGATNKVVDAVNDAIRKKIFDTSEPFVENDLVRVNSPSMIKDQDDKIVGMLPNGYKGKVINVEKLHHISAGKNILELYRIELEHEGIDKEGKPMKERRDMITINPKDKALLKTVLNDLAIEAKKYTKGTKESKEAWAKFFNLKDAIVDLGYAYAITSHKVQGSTYNSTYVLEEDIMGFPGGREQTNRMMYTAVSRPRKKLVIYNRNQEVGPKKQASSEIIGNLEGQKILDNQIDQIVKNKKEESKECNGG